MTNKEPRIPSAENSLQSKNRAVEPVHSEKATLEPLRQI